MVINDDDDIDGLKSFLRNRSTEMKIQEYSCIYFPSICLKSKNLQDCVHHTRWFNSFSHSSQSVSQADRQIVGTKRKLKKKGDNNDDSVVMSWVLLNIKRVELPDKMLSYQWKFMDRLSAFYSIKPITSSYEQWGRRLRIFPSENLPQFIPQYACVCIKHNFYIRTVVVTLASVHSIQCTQTLYICFIVVINLQLCRSNLCLGAARAVSGCLSASKIVSHP